MLLVYTDMIAMLLHLPYTLTFQCSLQRLAHHFHFLFKTHSCCVAFRQVVSEGNSVRATAVALATIFKLVLCYSFFFLSIIFFPAHLGCSWYSKLMVLFCEVLSPKLIYNHIFVNKENGYIFGALLSLL